MLCIIYQAVGETLVDFLGKTKNWNIQYWVESVDTEPEEKPAADAEPPQVRLYGIIFHAGSASKV